MTGPVTADHAPEGLSEEETKAERKALVSLIQDVMMRTPISTMPVTHPIADRILASDWLAAHDRACTAALREQVARVEALARAVVQTADRPTVDCATARVNADALDRLRAATTTDHTTDAARAVDAENGGEHG